MELVNQFCNYQLLYMKNATGIFLAIILLLRCNPQVKKENTSSKSDSAVINKASAPVSDSVPAPDRFRKQFEEGTDFLASGNEPFWSLEIDFDKSMHFKTLNGFEITTPSAEGVKAMDANVTRYQANTEKGTLTIQLQKMECIDDMSGEKLEYRVTIDTKTNAEKNYTIYKGCGRYLADYRLHDIWVLESINNKNLNVADFIKGLPQLELNLREKKIFGHTGCNTMNGTMEVLGKKIRFGRLATTRMACNNAEFENSYLKNLDDQTLSYSVRDGKLLLQQGQGLIYKYRKVD